MVAAKAVHIFPKERDQMTDLGVVLTAVENRTRQVESGNRRLEWCGQIWQWS